MIWNMPAPMLSSTIVLVDKRQRSNCVVLAQTRYTLIINSNGIAVSNTYQIVSMWYKILLAHFVLAY